ncbi:MAG: hypothetical protein ACK5KR_00700 [Breznakia sp.]
MKYLLVIIITTIIYIFLVFLSNLFVGVVTVSEMIKNKKPLLELKVLSYISKVIVAVLLMTCLANVFINMHQLKLEKARLSTWGKHQESIIYRNLFNKSV